MKQVIVVRNDLKMSKGKTAAQACHACLGAYKKADSDKIRFWEQEGQKKVIVKVNSLEELFEIKEIAKKNNVPNFIVKDAGRTELPTSTITCLGVGPDTDEIIDKVTQDLKLLS
ncbi:peptidyl-tRNA hydrolase [Methanobrevibacter arboriphilus]|jgi:PTH2 family peptidyl-tRNA hydrolase|uniref:Peptidyl-tRNA hydrolase n=2 Tax=Methanobrevibacter arboriphilus TaxID=39441 RepID=A0ACA8R2R9_METAZ|nr:peptidyl-tRNA hydrolase Pth2 [Methanobrevibacter arboriphilus]MCC7562565.1 peptidyl-tRNA hydrolase Pth2 [Methanobrevibacter arboriphilus]BBL61857.1 peptidyl-tRNA hydrolase [Methanobrevibacter arboriphilus]GLI10969.1 peptidyl-tRNA hydrolase [Methanobrevibacter arboriphilus]